MAIIKRDIYIYMIDRKRNIVTIHSVIIAIIFDPKELRYFYSTLYIHLTLDRVYTCETIWVSVCTRAIASYRDSSRSAVCARDTRVQHTKRQLSEAQENGEGAG